MKIEISPKAYEKSSLNFYDAKLYCELLEIDGKNDWRLPTLEELNYIFAFMLSDNHFNQSFAYWTSTKDIQYAEDRIWVKNMSEGSIHSIYMHVGKFTYIRPVRTV
jgi:hypothetical protein